MWLLPPQYSKWLTFRNKKQKERKEHLIYGTFLFVSLLTPLHMDNLLAKDTGCLFPLNSGFECSSCLALVQTLHWDFTQVQTRTSCQITSSGQKMRILCHLCAPGKQCWLSQQVASPASLSALNSVAPRKALGIALAHRGACCILGRPGGKRLHVCNCTVLVGATFSHTQGIFSHVHGLVDVGRHWYREKTCLPNLNSACVLYQWPNRRLIPAIILLSGRTEVQAFWLILLIHGYS